MYFSQIQQDEALDRALFCHFRNGVFVDIGANDGVTLSNTCFFERELNWTGLCIEPDPNMFRLLVERRNSTCLNIGIGSVGGVMPFLQVEGPSQMLSGFLAGLDQNDLARIDKEVAIFGGSKNIIELPVRTLADVLKSAGISEVHYMSIDVEGFESEVLSTLSTSRAFVHALSVEYNNIRRISEIKHVIGPSFELVCRHRHDLFFVNRNSPFIMNRIKLWRFLKAVAIKRMLGKLARRIRP